ncbi:MAG: hypothetical protein AAGC93_08645 [Cyanobacteria bacterium P01_F01_bin.53]
MEKELNYAALNATERAIIDYLAMHYPDREFQAKDVTRAIRAADNGRCIAKNYANYSPALAQDGWLNTTELCEATHYKRGT